MILPAGISKPFTELLFHSILFTKFITQLTTHNENQLSLCCAAVCFNQYQYYCNSRIELINGEHDVWFCSTRAKNCARWTFWLTEYLCTFAPINCMWIYEIIDGFFCRMSLIPLQLHWMPNQCAININLWEIRMCFFIYFVLGESNSKRMKTKCFFLSTTSVFPNISVSISMILYLALCVAIVCRLFH